MSKQLTLTDVVGRKFLNKTLSDVQWLPDSSAFTFTKTNPLTYHQEIYRHNISTHEETLILDGSSLFWKDSKIELSGYKTTGNQNILLISGEQKQIWRYSYAAPHYLYDTETHKLIALASADPHLQNVELSPDNHHVAFVKSSNLYVASCSNEADVKQLTHDGSDDVLNGIFDWVYEEEFQRPDAFRWSPDSKKIAFWWTDQTRVKVFALMDDTSSLYPKINLLKYPKVGEQNAIINIKVVDIETGKITKIDIGEEDDIYIPRIDWTTSSDTLCVRRLNRKQNKLDTLFADVNSGKTQLITCETNPEGWIVIQDLKFFKKKDEFLGATEASGYCHIFHSNYKGEQRQITKGEWEVSEINGFDEEGGWVYFSGKKDGPHNEVLYRAHIYEDKIETISEKIGWNTAIYSPNYKYYVGTRSAYSVPDQVFLYTCDGKKVKTLEENIIPALSDYTFNWPEFSLITIDDGRGGKLKLSSYIIKPKNFDPSKKYPVLVFGYSGPEAQVVVNRWVRSRALWHSLLADKGCIIFCCDARGTSGMGRKFKNEAYRDISKWMVHDQIEAVKYLRTLDYVDSSRVAVWGWSGGGYLALMCLMRGSSYYSCGIAVAPVSDFRNYDTIWTERYMDELSANPEGYKASDVLEYVNSLQGNLLVVHGSGDDNVHLQNTMALVDKLVAANKQFELMIYPNRNHGIYGGNTQMHLYTLLTNFLTKNLNLNK